MSNVYSDITKAMYTHRALRQKRLQRYSQEMRGNLVADSIADFASVGAEMISAIIKHKAEMDENVKRADMQFVGSNQMNKATKGLGYDQYKDFIDNQSKKIREGTKLTQKYRTDSDEYRKGKEMITQANRAVQNAAANRDRLKDHWRSQYGLDLSNIDNTASAEQTANTLSIQNGTFMQRNSVYIDDDGNFMYKRKVKSQIIAHEDNRNNMIEKYKDYEAKEDKARMMAIDKMFQNHVFSNSRSTLPNGGEGPATIDDGTLTNMGLGTPYSYNVVPSDTSNPNSLNRLVQTEAISIFDAPTAFSNQQLKQDSLNNQVESLNSLWEQKGFKQDLDNGATAFSDDEVLNQDTQAEIEKQVGLVIDRANDNEFSSYVNNGVIELVVDDKIKNVHPAEILLWKRGVDNPELSREEYVQAKKKWDKGETFTAKLQYDPEDSSDDKDFTWKTEKQYNNALKAYKLAELQFSQVGVLPEDRETIKDIIVDNTMARNKIGHDKYKKRKREDGDRRWTESDARERAINTYLKDINEEKPMTLSGLRNMIDLSHGYRVRESKDGKGFVIADKNGNYDESSYFDKYDAAKAQRILRTFGGVDSKSRTSTTFKTYTKPRYITRPPRLTEKVNTDFSEEKQKEKRRIDLGFDLE